MRTNNTRADPGARSAPDAPPEAARHLQANRPSQRPRWRRPTCSCDPSPERAEMPAAAQAGADRLQAFVTEFATDRDTEQRKRRKQRQQQKQQKPNAPPSLQTADHKRAPRSLALYLLIVCATLSTHLPHLAGPHGWHCDTSAPERARARRAPLVLLASAEGKCRQTSSLSLQIMRADWMRSFLFAALRLSLVSHSAAEGSNQPGRDP